MNRSCLLVAGLLLALLAGCTATSPPPPRDSQPPRVRCLADRNEVGTTRPLLFFFCVESP
jgi:hypothetical protein